MTQLLVTEAELHANVDGLLPEARRAEIMTYLATHPEDAQRVRAWQEQNQALHAWFDPVIEEYVRELPPTPKLPVNARSELSLSPNLPAVS